MSRATFVVEAAIAAAAIFVDSARRRRVPLDTEAPSH
jgi:uncharacterized protein (DUF1778 family)